MTFVLIKFSFFDLYIYHVVVLVLRNPLILKLRASCYRLYRFSDLSVAETVTKILRADIVIVLERLDITN